MALWKARSLTPEQKVQLVEDDPETKTLSSEESGSFLGMDDVSMSEVHSCTLPFPVIPLSLSLQIIGSIFNFFVLLRQYLCLIAVIFL